MVLYRFKSKIFYSRLSILYLIASKLVTSGLVAAIENNRDRHRYNQLHRLVRADGLGEWSSVIQEVLTGTTNQYLLSEAREEQRNLSQRFGAGTWQHEAVSLIQFCLDKTDSSCNSLNTSKLAAQQWFEIFTQLRNKTRGHGAPPTKLYREICPSLENSIRLILDNLILFQRPWVYLYRTLSGKYRVIKMNDQAQVLDFLKKSQYANLYKFEEGVYIYFSIDSEIIDNKIEIEKLVKVDLLKTDVDSTDFFVPNGGFNKNKFEYLSYISGEKEYEDSQIYSAPTTSLPESETQGLGILDVQGATFGNLPPMQKGYIKRNVLEDELLIVLQDQRHPVITLIGRGGIGKTWLALSVLHKIAESSQFMAMLWFSARDIDLLSEGPKLVKPHILKQAHIAEELVALLEPKESKLDPKKFKSVPFLINALQKTDTIEGPILFILDNFETVENPIELFNWLNTYIRLPNKILITTRFREFKGDYPVEILGMNEEEVESLVRDTAKQLNITTLLTDSYLNELYRESDGHPYVIKILLGEVAKTSTLQPVQRIIAKQDDILRALFERVFGGLSPAARRIFLTLSNWRSAVPIIALEAVLIRPANERIDVDKSVEELVRSSFIEIAESHEDRTIFISVPLVAAIFGQQKLTVSTLKNTVEVDTQILQMFGVTQHHDIQRGFKPKIKRIIKNISEKLGRDPSQVDEYIPMLEFIADRYPSAWLMVAELYEEHKVDKWPDRSIQALTRYLESEPEPSKKSWAWRKLGDLYSLTKDSIGAIHSFVESSKMLDVEFSYVSFTANRVNQFFRDQYSVLPAEEKQELARQMAIIMEPRVHEADATDCSRLAWLFMHMRDYHKAHEYVYLGLKKDGNNDHCWNLLDRLRSEHNLS